MGLQTKFNIVLIVACLIGIAATGALAYRNAQEAALAEIEREVSLLRANALAVRHFTVTEFAPLIDTNDDILFVPQIVPSYTAQAVFARFQDSFRDYSYREAVLDPTNPDDRPTPLEAELIQELRADEALDRIARQVSEPDGRFYTVAFRLKITNEACLKCHSTPDAAPASMVDLYGPKNGFGWQYGETVGAQVIKVPMAIAEKRATQTVTVVLTALGTGLVLVLIIINVLLNRIVVKPVLAMAQAAEKVSLGDFSEPEYSRPGRDEIASARPILQPDAAEPRQRHEDAR